MNRLRALVLCSGLFVSAGLLHADHNVVPTVMPSSAPAADPCPPAPVESCLPCPAPCSSTSSGPRLRLHVPAPIITFRKCGTKVVEAQCEPCVATAHCAPAAPACHTCAPKMTTVMMPYTYYTQVPTYGVVPAANYGAVAYGAAPVTYGAAPVAYGAAPVAYGAAPVAYGAAPVAYGAAPVAYGAAPVAYGAAPVAYAAAPVAYGAPQAPTYGAPPERSERDKCCTELTGKVDKLQTDVALLAKKVSAVGSVIYRQHDQIAALRELAVKKTELKQAKLEDRWEELKTLESLKRIEREDELSK